MVYERQSLKLEKHLNSGSHIQQVHVDSNKQLQLNMFHLNGYTLGFKSLNQLVQHNQYHRNGHTSGFHSQT